MNKIAYMEGYMAKTAEGFDWKQVGNFMEQNKGILYPVLGAGLGYAAAGVPGAVAGGLGGAWLGSGGPNGAGGPIAGITNKITGKAGELGVNGAVKVGEYKLGSRGMEAANNMMHFTGPQGNTASWANKLPRVGKFMERFGKTGFNPYKIGAGVGAAVGGEYALNKLTGDSASGWAGKTLGPWVGNTAADVAYNTAF